MKDFFTKIWEWIKKAWAWLIGLLLSVPVTKLYYFIAGLIVASAIAILGVDGIQFYPAVAVLFIAAFVETCLYIFTNRGWRVWNFIATVLGGIVIQLIVILR